MNQWLQNLAPEGWGDVLQEQGMWLAIGCGAVALLLVLRMLFRRKPESSSETREASPSHSGVFGSLTDAFAAQLPESQKESSDFAQMMRQAGLYSPTARASIYALRFVLLLIPVVVGGILAVMWPEYGVLCFIAGGILGAGLSITPRFYVFVRRNRRLLEIRQGLADMMDMLSMCLGGGMPLSPSLDHVAKNLGNYPSLAEELQILKRQAEVGSMRLALRDFAQRIDLPEVRQVTSLLGRGEQLGTRLSTSLLDQADHFRATRRQVATTRANRSPVILTLPLLFCFAPAVLILLMSPAMLELTDFLNPADGSRSVLDGNETLGSNQIVRTLDGLDQNLPPAP